MVVLERENLNQQQQRFRSIRESLSRFSDLQERAGRELLHWVDRNFQAEGKLLEEYPSGWPPLSPRTLRQRLNRGMGSHILEATGTLRKGSTLQREASRTMVFNPVPHARFHQLGEGVPARPIFPGIAQARRIIHPALETFVREALQ